MQFLESLYTICHMNVYVMYTGLYSLQIIFFNWISLFSRCTINCISLYNLLSWSSCILTVSFYIYLIRSKKSLEKSNASSQVCNLNPYYNDLNFSSISDYIANALWWFTLPCFHWSIEFYPGRTFFEYNIIEVFECQGKFLVYLASAFNKFIYSSVDLQSVCIAWHTQLINDFSIIHSLHIPLSLQLRDNSRCVFTVDIYQSLLYMYMYQCIQYIDEAIHNYSDLFFVHVYFVVKLQWILLNFSIAKWRNICVQFFFYKLFFWGVRCIGSFCLV